MVIDLSVQRNIRMKRRVSQGDLAQSLNPLVEERVLAGFRSNFASQGVSQGVENWAPGVIVLVEYDMQIPEAVKLAEEALRPLGTISIAAEVCPRSQGRG
jgi:hypothetical protein